MNYKCFDLNITNKTSELCLLLLKAANEDVKSNKVIEKFQSCITYVNMLIEIQKDYSFITQMIKKHPNKNRKENSEKLLQNFLNKKLVSKVSVSQSKSGNGLGIYAQESINKYDLTMTIPVDEMITEHEAYSSKFGEFLSTNMMTKNMPNISLALYLLNESMSGTTVHSDYISALPMCVDNFLYLQMDDIKLLQHSQYLSEIVQQFCMICCHYCYFYRIFSQFKSSDNCWFKDSFCFEDFKWAVAIVMSRNNAIPSNDGKSRMLALIPIWDMMNHKAGEVTTDFNDEKRCLMFYAMSSYKENDEICMDYGNRSNIHYFMYSGFIAPNNHHDTYNIKIGFNKQDSLYQLKRDILSKLSIDCENPIFKIDYLKSDILSKPLTLYLATMLIKDGRVLESFSNSVKVEEDILNYAETVVHDLKAFIKTRIKMNKSCINKSVEQLKMNFSVNTQQPIGAAFLLYENLVLEKILEKCD